MRPGHFAPDIHSGGLERADGSDASMRPGQFAPDIAAYAVAWIQVPGASMRPGHFAPDIGVAPQKVVPQEFSALQ